AGGRRLVLDDVLAGQRGGDAQAAVPLGLRADARHLHIELAQGAVHVADVGNTVGVGELLVPLVGPVGNVRVVGDHRQFEPWVRGHTAGDVVVLDGAENGTAERAGARHVSAP